MYTLEFNYSQAGAAADQFCKAQPQPGGLHQVLGVMWVSQVGQPKPLAGDHRTVLPQFCFRSLPVPQCRGKMLRGHIAWRPLRADNSSSWICHPAEETVQSLKLLFLPIPALIAGISPPSPPLPDSIVGGAPSQPVNYMEKAGCHADSPDVALTPSTVGDPEGNTRIEGEAVPAPAQPRGTSSDCQPSMEAKGTAPAHCTGCHFLRALQGSGPSRARPMLLGIHLHQPVQPQELEWGQSCYPKHFVVPVTLPCLMPDHS